VESKKDFVTNADRLFAKAIDSCRALGLTINRADPEMRRILADSGPSLLSYGEKVEILVFPKQEGGSTVLVIAHPKVWFNITSNPQGVAEAILSRLEDEQR